MKSPGPDEVGKGLLARTTRVETTLYASLYRGDDVMLVNTHAYGSPASQSPVLQLQRLPGGQVFDHYAHSFEEVWATARPYEIDRRAEAG